MYFKKKIALLLSSVLCFSMLLCTMVFADHLCGVVTADCLNVRSGPSKNHSIVGHVHRGNVLNIEECTNGWAKINYNNMKGYVSEQYISKRTESDHDRGGEERTAALGIVTANCLNIRCGPATSYSVVGRAYRGDILSVEECCNGWTKVTHNNTKGYVSSQYISKISNERGDGSLGEQVFQYSKQFLGTPYVYGGASPSGFDCSGFVYYCYNSFGVHVNRVAADQMKNGYAVSKDELMPGDLVFFYSKVGSRNVGHVGMYAGGGEMIHSPSTGSKIRFDSITTGSYNNRYAGARRIS